MKACAKGLAIVLVIFLGLTVGAKFFGGYRQSFSVSREIFIVATIVEVALAFGLLLSRLRRLAAVGVCVMALLGIAVELLSGGATCGCLGATIRLTSAQHILINATVGALAALVWGNEIAVDRK